MVQNEPRPRGRPRGFDSDQVLEKARDVFWSRGYSAASLDDIASATGLNRPSLYAAFGDKHALYMRTLERSQAEVVAGIDAMLRRPGTLREVLRALFAAAIATYVDGARGQRGCFIIGTAVTQAVDDLEARALLTAFVGAEDELFRARFSQSANQLAPGTTPDDAAVVATATLHTLAIRARTGGGAAALGRIAEAAVKLICAPP